MTDYLYDGTFEGVLTCIYHHYYTEKAAGIFPQADYQSTMLGGYRIVETDEEKAQKVYNAIDMKISAFDLRRMYRVFCSCVDGRETMILKYVVKGFHYGNRISSLHSDPDVYDCQMAEHKVSKEIDKMLGILRFSALGGNLGDDSEAVYYAECEPDCDMIEFLAGHFSNSFREQKFVIHDLSRNKAVISSGGEWYISEFEKDDFPPLSAGEEQTRKLWRMYFDTIAIKERTNPRCQRNFLPMRYRKHLTEMQG